MKTVIEACRCIAYYAYNNGAIKRTDTETAEHFHLAERYLRSLKRKTLKELQDGMNDGQII